MPQSSWIGWLTERLAVALVSGVASALTLALYPLALIFFGRGTGAPDLVVHLYSFMSAKGAIIVIVIASLGGFCLGLERMANIFALLWGTHKFWTIFAAYLEDKVNDFKEERHVLR